MGKSAPSPSCDSKADDRLYDKGRQNLASEMGKLAEASRLFTAVASHKDGTVSFELGEYPRHQGWTVTHDRPCLGTHLRLGMGVCDDGQDFQGSCERERKA